MLPTYEQQLPTDKLETKQTALETIKTAEVESKPRTLSILSG
jgi:hypothetical protein